MSDYLIQVVHRASGQVVEWAPGHVVEKEFEQELLNRVRAKGVGMLRPTEHVVKDVLSALEELIFDLKKQVPY